MVSFAETVPSSSNGPMGHVPGNSCAISVVNSIGDHSLGFNEQLTLAVFKLQHSLDRVVNRIDALESMLTIQSVSDTVTMASVWWTALQFAFLQKCLQTEQSTRSSAVSNWLFPELNSKTTAFVIAWPVIVFFALNYVKQIRKKWFTLSGHNSWCNNPFPGHFPISFYKVTQMASYCILTDEHVLLNYWIDFTI